MVLITNIFTLAWLLLVLAGASSADTTARDELKKGALRGRSIRQQDEEGNKKSDAEEFGIQLADTSANPLVEEQRQLNRLFGAAHGGGSSSQQVSPAEAAILLAANPFSHTSTANDGLVSQSGARIIGGTSAGSTEIPYFVQGDGCGATLIWYDIALTAAHCMGGPFNYGVMIGNYRRNSMDGNPQIRLVSSQIGHPNYNSTTNNNDFLLLKLNAEVNRTGRSQPILLNNATSDPADGSSLTIFGFGITTEGGTTLPTSLLKATVNAVSQSSCNTSYGGKITSAMLCAAYPGKDTCQGDSGGPIVNAAGVQVGVTSWGNGCARVNYPGVYARVSGAYKWIREQVCSLSRNPPPYCGLAPNTGGGSGTSSLRNVTFILQADRYPGETSWTLQNSAGQMISNQTAKSVTIRRTLIQRSFSLPAGTYTLAFADSWGDGFCCQYGMGFYLIMVDGVVVLQNLGRFVSSLKTSFTI